MSGHSVLEQAFQGNHLDDEALCNSPTPLATSTAKKKLSTQPCTSFTQAALSKKNNDAADHLSVEQTVTQNSLAVDQGVFKHPGIYFPGGNGIQQMTGKRLPEMSQQKNINPIENLPLVMLNENSKLEMSIVSERSNASSMGLIPDDLLNSQSGEMLVPPQETSHFGKFLEQSCSLNSSEMEQARRCPVDDSYKNSLLGGTSHFASAQAFLQMQHMKTGADANLSQPRVVLADDEICRLDNDFGPEEDNTMMLEEPIADPSIDKTPVRIALNDIDTRAKALIKSHGKPQLEEVSYCSSLGVSHYQSQSFSLEKMLRGNKAEEKSLSEDLSQGDDACGVDWDKSITFSCDPYPVDGPAETSRLYDDDPFQTELAYRTEFDANLPNVQNVELPEEFFSYEPAEEFFAKNDQSSFDELLQVPLAKDVGNWSLHSHISLSTSTAQDRMSLGTYMQTRSENIKNNQSLFNGNQTESELPTLTELEEEEKFQDEYFTIDGSIEDSQNQGNKQQDSPPPVLAQSIISNSLISNIIDMASMSMSNDEIANRFVAQLDKRQRTQSTVKKTLPSLNNQTQTLLSYIPDNHGPRTPQPGPPQQERTSNALPSSPPTNIVGNSSQLSTPCSTHTLKNQSVCSLENFNGSATTAVPDQSYKSPVLDKNSQSPSSGVPRFRTPRESMYGPRDMGKYRKAPVDPKISCNLKFDDGDLNETGIGDGVVSKENFATVPGSWENAGNGLAQHLTGLSLKSAQGDACPSSGSKEESMPRVSPNKTLADLTKVLSEHMNATDTRKLEAILNHHNPDKEDIDESCPWRTMMEEPLGQTHLNSHIFTSTFLDDEGPSAKPKEGAEDFMFTADPSRQKPKFEVDRMVKIRECTIGISEKAQVTVRNLVDHWLECHIEILHLFVNGREVSLRKNNPFHIKDKLVLAPSATQNLEIVFFPKDPGSYMAEVRISSASQAYSPNQQPGNDYHMTCYMKLMSYADLPSVHFFPKELDFGQQSWGSTGCLPITIANKSKAKIPLRLVITSKSSNVFRWVHKSLPDIPGSESKYTVVSDNICCLTLPGAQAGCVLDMTPLDILCDLVKKCGLKDPNHSTSLIGVIEIQLDVPTVQPPLGIIQLSVTAGTAKLHVSNGADLIVMESSVNKSMNRTVTLRNAGTLDLCVALDISRHEQVFTLSSSYLKIPVGEKTEVNVSFHPMDDKVKSYNVEMMMFIEPSGPVFGIPIQGKVLSKSNVQPRQQRWLLADLSHINFGGIPLGQPKEITFRLKNSSSSIAKIELVMRSDEKNFKFSTLLNSSTRFSDLKSVVIQPDEIYPVTIAFNPTRASVFNGKINIKSSDDSTRFVVPLFGYGGLSEMFIAEPRSGILKITPTDLNYSSSQTVNFILRNSGIRDAFFSVQVYQDADKSVLVDKQSFAIHPQNGILKSLEKITVTVLCNPVAIVSLPVHLAIYHGDEEARQQMKRAVKKFPNQRNKWKWSEWFDSNFTNEDNQQTCDSSLSQREDFKMFYDHLSTLELTVELNKKEINNRWSSKKSKADLNSKPKSSSPDKENHGKQRHQSRPTKESNTNESSRFEKKLSEQNQVNVMENTFVLDSQGSSGLENAPQTERSKKENSLEEQQQKIWRVLPERLTFVSKDPLSFSIINFGEKTLNFQLSWATDRMSVSHSVVTINPHAVSEISVVPCPNEPWEGFIYITAESVMQKVSVGYKVYPVENSSRPPLQPISTYNNRVPNGSSPSAGLQSANMPVLGDSTPKQQFERMSANKPKSFSPGSSELPVRGPNLGSVELTPVNCSEEQEVPTELGYRLQEQEECVDIRVTSEIVQFYVESGCDLVSNSLEFTNFGQTNVNWFISNEGSFPYFSTDDGKRTVMESLDIFKIFHKEGTLSAGQKCKVHILFYPEVFFDKRFVCYHSCKLICQLATTSPQRPHYKNNPTIIPFLLQGFLTSDRCSLASLMSDTESTHSSLTSSIASSTKSTSSFSSSSCASHDQKLIVRPDVVTFQPCQVGKMQQVKVEVKNRNTEPVKICVGGLLPDDVFSVSVKTFLINPKKLVKVPVAFKPIRKGFANGQIVFSCLDTNDQLKIQLFAVGL